MQNCKGIVFAIVFCLAGLSSSLSWGQGDIRLIVRGDDMGMTEGSLEGYELAFNHGILTCAAIQVPAPWFEGAASLCKKNPGWCIGVHLCLIGEWQGYRWRPVLPWDKVSTLVDENGYLYRYPDELFAKKPSLKEIEAEFRAQIELAKKYGVNIQYLDTHYQGYDSYPGLEEVYKKLGREYDLPISGMMNEQRFPGVYDAPLAEKTAIAAKQLQELKPGLYLWVNHIGIDSPEQDALYHAAPAHLFTNGVGKNRAAELKAVTSIEVKSMIMKKGIKLVNYRELWQEQKKKK